MPEPLQDKVWREGLWDQTQLWREDLDVEKVRDGKAG